MAAKSFGETLSFHTCSIYFPNFLLLDAVATVLHPIVSFFCNFHSQSQCCPSGPFHFLYISCHLEIRIIFLGVMPIISTLVKEIFIIRCHWKIFPHIKIIGLEYLLDCRYLITLKIPQKCPTVKVSNFPSGNSILRQQ